MQEIDGEIITQYFKRSYFALDGLWFVVVEKNSSLKKALKIDEQVWRVLPKIQARKVRKLLNLKENTVQNFVKALEVKLKAENYQYKKKITEENLHLLIKKCPWHQIIRKSGREHVLPNNICRIDFQTWGDEFHLGLKVKIGTHICGGDANCEIHFTCQHEK